MRMYIMRMYITPFSYKHLFYCLFVFLLYNRCDSSFLLDPLASGRNGWNDAMSPQVFLENFNPSHFIVPPTNLHVKCAHFNNRMDKAKEAILSVLIEGECTCMYIRMYMYVCMYVYIHIYVYVCMYTWIDRIVCRYPIHTYIHI